MTVVCENTQADDIDLKVQSYECLSRIMSLYYDKMLYYMEKALFSVSTLYEHVFVAKHFLDHILLFLAHNPRNARSRTSRSSSHRILVDDL